MGYGQRPTAAANEQKKQADKFGASITALEAGEAAASGVR